MWETKTLASSTEGIETPLELKLEDNCITQTRGSLPFCWATLVSSTTLSQILDTSISEPDFGLVVVVGADQTHKGGGDSEEEKRGLSVFLSSENLAYKWSEMRKSN